MLIAISFKEDSVPTEALTDDADSGGDRIVFFDATVVSVSVAPEIVVVNDVL